MTATNALHVVELAEHGPAIPLKIDDAAGRALAASDVVEAAPDPYTPGIWQVKAGRKVGAATVTVPGGSQSITVRIAPKVPVARLLFLLGYSLDAKGWIDEDVQVSDAAEMVPAVARLFVRQAENALRQGLLQGYRTVEETAFVVRGRIRQSDQMRRHYGRPLPVEITHDEYTADIAENQLLRTACERLLRLPGGLPAEVRGALLRLRVRLADITLVGRGHGLPEWRPSRLNSRYRPALRLAELVLLGASVEHRAGGITVSGFLFDMPKVFEDFLILGLRDALEGADGHCRLQARHHLDERNRIRMIPDFVRYAHDGTPLAVADAKYKAEKRGGFPDADLYQMLAYCTALGLPEGHLVYAKGNAPHATHQVRGTSITIHQHALELDQTPEGLLAEVRTLAERLAAPHARTSAYRRHFPSSISNGI